MLLVARPCTETQATTPVQVDASPHQGDSPHQGEGAVSSQYLAYLGRVSQHYNRGCQLAIHLLRQRSVSPRRRDCLRTARARIKHTVQRRDGGTTVPVAQHN